ncbi:MAG: rhodanese-like domain-containing protein [Pseudomonadota bacterium]
MTIRALLCASTLASAAPAFAVEQDALDKIHAKIEASRPDVEHLTADDLQAMDPASVILLDVREPREYEVSRLPGAVRIDPDSEPGDLAALADAVAGKTVVLYCSVGRRSSDLADRNAEAFRALGAEGVYNLEGGVFRWANERRPLERDGAATDVVHPYNWWWGRLIEDRSIVRYEPENR